MNDLLEGLVTSDYLDAINRISDALVSIGHGTHIDEMTQLEATADNLERDQLVATVDTSIRTHAMHVLDQHEIIVSDEVTLDQLYWLLTTLHESGQFVGHEECNAILEAAIDPLESFCEVLAVVTPISAEQWLETIELVSGSLITGLLALTRTVVDVEVSAGGFDATLIQSLSSSAENAWIQAACESRLPIGTDPELLLEHTQSTLPYDNPPALAEALVGVCVYGGVALEQLESDVTVMLEQIYDDLPSISKARLHLRSYLETHVCKSASSS